ncbi:hypothetical protein [Thauera linaloolentis]|nr:hypothetical protein [Thauera linaloolentis]
MTYSVLKLGKNAGDADHPCKTVLASRAPIEFLIYFQLVVFIKD